MGERASRPSGAVRDRGPQLVRLILDTSVLVGPERDEIPLARLGVQEDDVAIAALTAAELLVGVELGDDRRRQARRARVESLLAAIPIESYDLDVARAHARLLAHSQRLGRMRGAHDVIIAATGLARSRIVVTADAAGFADLPGVDVRVV